MYQLYFLLINILCHDHVSFSLFDMCIILVIIVIYSINCSLYKKFAGKSPNIGSKSETNHIY